MNYLCEEEAALKINLYMAILIGIMAGMVAMVEETFLAVGLASVAVLVGNGSAFLENFKEVKKNESNCGE